MFDDLIYVLLILLLRYIFKHIFFNLFGIIILELIHEIANLL